MEKHLLNHSDLGPSPKRHQKRDKSLPDEKVATQHTSEDQKDHQEFICNDCKAVDWSSLPNLASDGLIENEHLVLRSLNATIEELRTSSCRICAILSTIKRAKYDGKRVVLKAFPFSGNLTYDGGEISRALRYKHHTIDRAAQCTVLGVSKTTESGKYFFGPSLAVGRIDQLGTRKVTTSSIDYNKINVLVRTCEAKHKRRCSVESRPNVLGLEVIDTKTQRVVKAPDRCKYLALSYVWGRQDDNSSVHDIQSCPPVVKDAVSVTNSLGYNYLWVDRYCISDSREKSQMISQMDQIYANSSITIIAAADGDTETGLCGVSMLRQPQRHVEIQDVALLELPLGHEDLTSSKWASRGWTYQEGYLSAKRLIFTKTQVLFLCNGMYASESLQQLLDTTFCSESTRDFHHLIPRFQGNQRRFTAQVLLRQIEEYSKRNLTRSSDSLNAILGVLNFYAENSATLTSPVLRLPWGLIANKSGKRKSRFSLHFFWYHENSPTRRTEFPSWSWTGWGGGLKFYGPETVLQPEHENEQGPFAYLDWSFSMKEEDGRVVKMYELACKEFEARKNKHRLYQPGPKQLQVSCLVMPVNFQEFDLTADQRKHATEISIRETGKTLQVGRDLSVGAHPVLQVWEGIYVGIDKAYLRLSQQVEQQDSILGLIYGADNKYGQTDFYCLLVRQVGEALYERVGMLLMSDIDLAPYWTVPKGFPYAVRSQMSFLDSMGSVLDGFTISDRQRRYPFTDTAEPRTLFLV